MSAAYFNLFAADLVPKEHKAMQRARSDYSEALFAAIEARHMTIEVRSLEQQAAAAEVLCRAAFKHALHMHIARIVLGTRKEGTKHARR